MKQIMKLAFVATFILSIQTLFSQQVMTGGISKNPHPTAPFVGFEYSALKSAVLFTKLTTQEVGSSYSIDIVGGDNMMYGKSFSIDDIPGTFPGAAQYFSHIETKQNSYLLRSGVNKKTDLGIVYFQPTVDFLDGSKVPLIVADTFFHKGLAPVQAYANVSADKNQVVLIDEHSFIKGADKMYLGISWFDDKLNLQKRGVYSFPVNEKRTYDYQVGVTNGGVVYILLKSMKMFSPEEYYLLVVNKNSTELSQIKLDRAVGALVKGTLLMINGENAVLSIWQTTFSAANYGFITGTISPTAKTINWNYTGFNKSQFEINSSDTGKLSIIPRVVGNVITDDHRIIRVFDLLSSSLNGIVPAGSSPEPYTIYHGGNLAVFCFDSTGKFLWKSVVERNQNFTGKASVLTPFVVAYGNDVVVGWNKIVNNSSLLETQLVFNRIDISGKVVSGNVVLPVSFNYMYFNPSMISVEKSEKRICMLYEDLGHSQFSFAYLKLE